MTESVIIKPDASLVKRLDDLKVNEGLREAKDGKVHSLSEVKKTLGIE